VTDVISETREQLDDAFAAFHAQRDLSVVRFQTCNEVQRLYHKAAAHLERDLPTLPHAQRLECQPEKWVVNVLFDRLQIDTFHMLRCVGGHCIDEAEATGLGKLPPTLEEIREKAAQLRRQRQVSNKFARHEHGDGLRIINTEDLKWSLR